MLEPKDLRRTNYLNNGTMDVQVDSIEFDDVKQKWVVYWGGFCYSEYLENCKLIPLTEEWLVKFGGVLVKETSKSKTYKFTLFNIVFAKGTRKDWFYIEEISRVFFKYVHQLQNLYFLLIGDNLEIKEAVK